MNIPGLTLRKFAVRRDAVFAARLGPTLRLAPLIAGRFGDRSIMEEIDLVSPDLEEVNLIRMREIVRRVLLRLRIDDDGTPPERLLLESNGAHARTEEAAVPASHNAGTASAGPFGETGAAGDSEQ